MRAADVVILGAARTPIGRYGGSLRDLHPAELGAVAARAALERAKLSPDDIDDVLIGHGRQAGSGPNPARQVGRRAGIPDAAPAQTINKACASGLQAIASGAQEIMLGEADAVLAGGIESMSRMPYLIDSEDARWGHKMGNFALVDAMYRDGFTCSRLRHDHGGDGGNARAAVRHHARAVGRVSRSRASAGPSRRIDRRTLRATRSRRCTLHAIAKGTPTSTTRRHRDEHPRARHHDRDLTKLPPVFGAVDGQPGIITAGSSSGITDGGAALVLMYGETARRPAG